MTVRANPKPETYRNPKYLRWIRTLPCGICGKPAEPSHTRRSYWGAGTSQKPHDYVAVPRCRYCHVELFEDDVEREIINLLMAFIEK